MRGHSASEDARERAYDPRIHPLRKKSLQKSMDCTATRACPSCAVLCAASRVNPTCGVKPGNDAPKVTPIRLLGMTASQLQRNAKIVDQVEARRHAEKLVTVHDDGDVVLAEQGQEIGASAEIVSRRVTITSLTGRAKALFGSSHSVRSAASTSLSSTRPTTRPPSSTTGSCDTSAERMRANTVRRLSCGRTTTAVPSL